MPTLPASPAPLRISGPETVDPVLIQEFDQGHQHRRSRYSRGRRRYTLEYLVNSRDLHILTDFFERQTRAGALSFEWTFPYTQTVINISSNTPNIVTTNYEHGYQTNQQAKITGTSSHNGTYSIQWFTSTRFFLLGTSGGTPETWSFSTSPARAALHFPTMVLLTPEVIPSPRYREGFGDLGDARGLFDFSVTLEEKYG